MLMRRVADTQYRNVTYHLARTLPQPGRHAIKNQMANLARPFEFATYTKHESAWVRAKHDDVRRRGRGTGNGRQHWVPIRSHVSHNGIEAFLTGTLDGEPTSMYVFSYAVADSRRSIERLAHGPADVVACTLDSGALAFWDFV